ncbi:hypothetical protein GF354_02830 [Candidatus Peregrinibacteria bacterium]|nr:hypothetical protein [Candidatus Peregrinibacteria bacterium]
MERECGKPGEEEQEPVAEASVSYGYIIEDGERREIGRYSESGEESISLKPGITIGVSGYDYDGEKVFLEVNEGEVEIWRTDFQGNAELIATVPEGENYEINLADYNKTVVEDEATATAQELTEGEDTVEADVEDDARSKADAGNVKDLNNMALYIGGGVGAVLLLALIVIFIKRKSN